MFSKFMALALVAGLSVFALVRCGSSGASSGVSVNVVSLSSAISSREPKLFSVADLTTPLTRAVGDFGAAPVGASGLESYKLYISSIQVCESLTTSVGSTAYSSPTNCSTIYTNDADNYDTFSLADAAAATSGKYIDILSQTDRATLSRTASVTAGTYNVGIINWFRPIKIKGTVPLTGGSLHTKACPSTGACTLTTNLGTGVAEESIVDLNNGGTWFRFLKPFVVTAGESVNVDLAFDLEKKLFGGENVSNGFVQNTSTCTLPSGPNKYCGIFAPILRLSPVPRKSTETTQVETYEMDVAGTNKWKLRVDVFYNSADTTKAVLAADVYPIPTANTDISIIDNIYVYSVAEASGTTTFKQYDDSTSVVFTRGATGTGTFTCPSRSLPGCSGVGANVALSWSSREVRTLQN